VSYVSAARSFAATSRLLTFSGRPLTLFPPGLSLVLAVGEPLGIGLPAMSVTVNALSFGLLCLGAYALSRQAGCTPRGALAAAAVVTLSYPALSVFFLLGTEALFCALVVGVLLLLGEVGAMPAKRAPFVLGAIVALTSAASVVKYTGAVLIATVWISLIHALRGRSRARSLAVATVTAALASLGLLLLVARNLRLGNGPFGDRDASAATLPGALRQAALTLGAWVVTERAPAVLQALCATLLVAIVALGFRAAGERRPGRSPVLLWIFLYWACLVFSKSATAVDPLDFRLTSPIFVPAVALVAGSTATLMRRSSGRALRITADLLVAAFLVFSAARMKNLARFARGGHGYNAVSLRSSPLSRAVRAGPAETQWASNDAHLLYWLTDRETAAQVPRLSRDRRFYRPRDLGSFRDWVASSSNPSLAWYAGPSEWAVTPEAMPPEAMRSMGIVATPYATFEDGVLYRLAPSPPDP
jgi:hypothetical protein